MKFTNIELENKVLMMKLRGYKLVTGVRKGQVAFTNFQPIDGDDDDIDTIIMESATMTYHSHFEYAVMLSLEKAIKYLQIEEF
jgi:hypothetical protein